MNPANNSTINISVITVRGYSDYSSNSGNTWDEVSDGYLDYYVEINLTDIGFVPEVQTLILSTLFLAIPIIIQKIKK